MLEDIFEHDPYVSGIIDTISIGGREEGPITEVVRWRAEGGETKQGAQRIVTQYLVLLSISMEILGIAHVC